MTPERLTRNDLAKLTLETIETVGWSVLTLHHIAAQGSLSLDSIHEFARSKEDLLDVVSNYIEGETQEQLSHEDFTDVSKADQLCEVLMVHFDVLSPHKTAIHRLYQDLIKEPCHLLPLIPQGINRITTLAAQGGYTFSGPCAPLQRRGFAVIYVNILMVWLNDESPDLSKTMAACNKAASEYVPCLHDPLRVMDILF